MKPRKLFFRHSPFIGLTIRYGSTALTGLAIVFTGLDANAADILRGGAASPAGGTPAAGGGAPTPAASDAARAQTRDILLRNNQTLDSMRAMQAAARAAAVAAGSNNLGRNPADPGKMLPDVPNGLGAGGLNASGGNSTPTDWYGAAAPTQQVSGGKTTVTIVQSAQQAVLGWESFNIGRDTTLTFDQSAGGANVGQWIAFNKVNDPTGNPTQILGNIKADGQVYLINRNGVIFGGASQVNARGLTVSSLPINQNLIDRGLLNNPDAQFLFSGLNIPAGLNGTPAFTPDRPLAANGRYGDVIVRAGAILESPTDAAKVGGHVTLVGPNVEQYGTILTPDGQAMLAAGLQVGFDGHATTDPSLRGLDVFVGLVSDPVAGLYAGTIVQQGMIQAQRGAISLSGREIRHTGALASTTSVVLNGRIDIQASYNAFANRASSTATGPLFLFRDTGSVLLGPNSTVSVLPEYDSKETAIGTELALRSRVNISGKSIHMGENSTVAAPNGIAALDAGSWLIAGLATAPFGTFVQSGGQIYLDRGAAIDVAGSIAVPVPVTQNIITLDLRSAELADSPLQRLGTLRNQSVTVDIRQTGEGWIGTPLANVNGFANLVERAVAQLTVAGGSVTLNAGDSVVMREGSRIDVSGGSTAFQGGMVRTTQLLTGGRLVDIGSASADVVYDGIYDGSFTQSNPKFGVSQQFGGVIAPSGARFENGYLQGAAGGTLSISAPSMALDGGMKGITVSGERQRNAPPVTSTLNLSFTATDVSYASLPVFAPAPPTLTFKQNPSGTPVDAFSLDASGNPRPLAPERVARVELSSQLMSRDGFGVLNVNNPDGDIVVPEGVTLSGGPGGSISLSGSNITVAGGIVAPQGSISISANNLSLTTINRLNNVGGQVLPDGDPARGIFTLSSTGFLNTAGQVIDDRLNRNPAGVAPLAINGGTIRLNAYTSRLAAGGVVDVSGGAYLSPQGRVSYGNGGRLEISAGRDLRQTGVIGGTLSMGSTLLGYSGATAGTLSLRAPAIQIGGSSGNQGVTLLANSFFNEGGFGTFDLGGVGLAGAVRGEFVTGVRVDSSARIRPIATSLIADVSGAGFRLRPIVLEEGLRTPGSILLSASGATNSFSSEIIGIGVVSVDRGSVMETDARGSVTISSEVVRLDGSIIAPGGSVRISGATHYPSTDPDLLLPTVLVGANASVSTAGKVVLLQNPLGLRQGSVIGGGSIRLDGNVVTERTAVFDVSGTSGILDLLPSMAGVNGAGGSSFVPVRIDSNGGQITLSGSSMLYSEATLIGRAGGTSAIGGSVSVSSGRFALLGAPTDTAEENLLVRQSGHLIPSGFASRPTGTPLANPNGAALPGIGTFSLDTLSGGGFDSLSLNGNVTFDGQVSLRLPGALRLASGGVLRASTTVDLAAGYIYVGQTFRPPALPTESVILFTRTDGTGAITPYTFAPTSGAGSLKLSAGLLDLGHLSLQGIGRADFDARNGEIRGNGTLSAAAALNFTAGQIHPTTAGAFNIFSYDHTVGGVATQGSVTIAGGAARQLPLSAGGRLGIYASQIQQSGVLRAPFGVIQLGWDGTGSSPAFNPIAGTSLALPVTSKLTLSSSSVTSTSAMDPLTGKGLILPYGISLDGTSWIDPAGNDITITGVPAQSVNLAALDLTTEAGSTIDIRGGGDLYAYRWVAGNGGSRDLLSSTTRFAVIPGYGFNYSPYAPFNTDVSATGLGGEPGYTNASLRPGDQITLAASANLPAGTYTLLPARYALLPGAVLITPVSTVPATTVKSPDGSTLVAGYQSNNLNPVRSGATMVQGFEVATAAIIRARSEYRDFLATSFLRDAPAARGFAIPRLPFDAGRLSFTSAAAMDLRGGVLSSSAAGGRGSQIDINSASNILINSAGTGTGGLVLRTGVLNQFSAESLLIGGLRSQGPDGVRVTASTSSITLDNADDPLVGKDIILASRGNLTLAQNARISAPVGSVALDSIILGSAVAGSGNGALARVSSDPSALVSRLGVTAAPTASLSIAAGVTLTGGSLTLDSTSATQVAASARLNAGSVSLSSGQLSIALSNPGTLNPSNGLVLGGEALASLQQSAARLSLLSYSTLDVYGTGTIGTRGTGSLSLQAAAIRGFNTGSGSVTFAAPELYLGSPSAATAPVALPAAAGGTLLFDADVIRLGSNVLRLDGFQKNVLAATGLLLADGQGALETANALDLVTPQLTGASVSSYQIRADGILRVTRPASAKPLPFAGGLGASLTLQGSGLTVDGDIRLPSGSLTLRATSGDLVIGGVSASRMDLAGTSKTFMDVTRFTHGGKLRLAADNGNVVIGSASIIDVSAGSGGGDAGAVVISNPLGTFSTTGSLLGTAGPSGAKGTFELDTGTLEAGSLAPIDAVLNQGGFTASRDYRVRTGDARIDGLATSQIYRLATDSGNITVVSAVNASGITGGTIDLKARGNLTLASGALLDASAQRFNSAGKGGSIVLEAGTTRDGALNPGAVLDLRQGSTIQLGVASATAGSPALGQFTGTLHLRAPRNNANNDLAIAAIGSTIQGASSILLEGVRSYTLTGSGLITTALRNSIASDSTAFLGAAGTTTAGYTAMLGRLRGLQPTLDLILAPGVEITNVNGSLTLGSASSGTGDDWNLASWRYGPRSSAGVLTLRASENIVLFNALSDGFAGGTSLWLSPLVAFNPLLPANTQSWSLRMTAGADVGASSFRAVRPLSGLATSAGFFQLGKNAGAANVTGGSNALTSSLITNLYQVVRTGSGNIDIQTGRSLQLLNPFASIYTAGTQVANPTTIATAGDFITPITARTVPQGNLGAAQQSYGAQYSMAGGNVTLTAGSNLERKTRNNSGLIDDSSRQLPNNWLYRRGYVDAAGNFGAIRIGTGIGATTDASASTTWWIDFSNFFQGVGALGGGNVSLTAGNDVMNMDAVIPTNSRSAQGRASTSAVVELGGGDLRVVSGRDINGGVYYVERGTGTLTAGGSITTNSTRSPSFGLVGNLNNPALSQLNPLTWMPTTLFVGKSSFNLTATGDLLLGPASNPFLLPQGVNNRFWYKSYFSTTSADSEVRATSLGGDVIYRNAITLPNQNQALPMLRAWHDTQLQLGGSASSTAWFQPWLRLAETSMLPFSPVWSLSASSVYLTSLAKDLKLAGDLTTYPSSFGQMELLAAGSIQALQPVGISNLGGGISARAWFSSTFNLSDADPASVPSSRAPLTSLSGSPTGAVATSNTVTEFMASLAALFVESGSVTRDNAVLQTRQARHTPGGLHQADLQPLRITALGGDLTGLTLFSGKQSRISAARDVTDIALYLQNNRANDLSIVTAGRNITAFDSTTPLRVASIAIGNALVNGQRNLSGDIQISGPGTLQVLAGRNIDLGTGPNNPDGTGTGITSIGSLRNPYLSPQGAGIIIGAGIGPAAELAASALDFTRFIQDFILTPQGAKYLQNLAPGVDFQALDSSQQSLLALEIFYQILRDTGRDFNNPDSPGYRKYDNGFSAIRTLFPGSTAWGGEILTQSRDIRTRNGGAIQIFAPGGGLTMADTSIGNPLTPPGIVTESGGSISIFADKSVAIGIGRIFTLKGGDVSIWSSSGDIAAGSSSRTVSAAPPTRVIIDPQSAAVQTDLAGLATGGGIGVLASVQGVSPGDVDLIAPSGVIDAGDAGIRVSGNINLAAVSVVNAGNISAGGTSSGAPSTSVSAPAISTVTSAANAAAAGTPAARTPAESRPPSAAVESNGAPSLYTVEVIGYGGGGGADEDDEEKKKKRSES